MNQQRFVDIVREHVRDAAVAGVVSLLERPPGRRPASDLVDLSSWYGRLSQEDRDRVRRALTLAAHQVVFGMFAILDGARAVEEAPSPRGRFEVRYVSPSGDESVIVGDDVAPLHEML